MRGKTSSVLLRGRARLLCSAAFLIAAILPDKSSAQILQTLDFLPGYRGIGPGGLDANGITASGTSGNPVVNLCCGRTVATFWTTPNNPAGLGTLNYNSSAARGISGNGAVVVGDAEDRTLNGVSNLQAFRWTSATGMVGLGFLPGDTISAAFAASGDGSVVVGYSGTLSHNQAFRWTASSGMVGLGFLPGGTISTAEGVSADGSVVVGASSAAGTGFNIKPMLWTASQGMVGLGSLPGTNGFGGASAVSANGQVVIGSVDVTNPIGQNVAVPFRWTASTGMVGLGPFAGHFNLNAMALNADGSVVVGTSNLAVVSNRQQNEAFRWTASTGMQSIQATVAAYDKSYSAWQMTAASGISADGTAILVAGQNGPTTIQNGVVTFPSYVGAAIVHVPLDAFALLDLAGVDHSLGSLLWGGTVINSGPGAATLTVGSDNTSTTFIGSVQNGTAVTALTKVGTGTLTLTEFNTYTGATFVNGGTLDVEGSIASSSLTTVNAGATLTGSGTVGNALIANGGAFIPGSGTPGSSMTVAGNLAFQSGALYLVQLNPATSSFANVTGTASLNGSAGAAFLAGNYVAKQYTILTAAGGVSGTFGSFNTLNVPSGFQTSLSYDATHAYLDLFLNFAPPHLNNNQQSVANALTSFFNRTGGIPAVFGALTPAGLTQVSGESATGSQQTTFDAMNLFMSLLTDPFVEGRGNNVSAGAGATAFAGADEEALAYAAGGKARGKSERDAYAAVYRKAPIMTDPFTQRWSVWAAGYGGSQTTDGNAVLGSNNTRSSIGGVAVGADYRFSPDTLAGFAIAGGATNFSVNGLGSGRSDLFQAGAFVRHTVGPAYISAALAYGWQDITTDRTVTVAGTDLLRANFNANAYSGRVEGGYRFVTPWLGGVGITPYAAGQFTTFDLPAYAEQAIAGANTFALTYAGKSATDTRSELGLRSDKSFAVQNGIFTLRGRAAWAHDFNTDRSIGATFQTLPGASFVVNGAAHAADSALVTASAEMKWLNGFALAGTFEGEFSNVTTSYAGKGVVRYAW
jgi:autotransporter-associated beta strand protein/probable HAF family extracellular repeat protein